MAERERIRTFDTVARITASKGRCLKPLSHLSVGLNSYCEQSPGQKFWSDRLGLARGHTRRSLLDRRRSVPVLKFGPLFTPIRGHDNKFVRDAIFEWPLHSQLQRKLSANGQ